MATQASRAWAVVAIGLIGPVDMAMAQDAPEPAPIILARDAAKDAKLFEFSFASPASPVLPLVGIGEDQITRVTDPRKFGAALVSDFSGGGKGGGLAIDLSPFWLFDGARMNIEEYRGMGGLARAAVRSSIGVAYSGGKSDASAPIPSSLVFSVSTRLLRHNDPLAAVAKDAGGNVRKNPDESVMSLFASCFIDPVFEEAMKVAGQKRGEAFSAALKAGLPNSQADAAGIKAFNDHLDSDAVKSALVARHSACKDETKAEMQRRASLDVGLGFRFTGKPGSLEGMEGSGTVLWGTFLSGVLLKRERPGKGDGGLRARLAVHGRVTIDEAFYDAAAVRTGRATSTLLVAGLESVVPPDGKNGFRWSLQGGWTQQGSPTAGEPDKDYGRFLGTAALKVSDGLWLTGTLGRVQGRGVDDDTYLLAGFAFSPPARESGFAKAFGK